MRKKKNIWVPIISVLLVLAIAGGIAAYFLLKPSAPVNVYNIEECYLYSWYWESGNTSEGIVSADKLQTVYISATQEVTEVNVQVGQQVHVGDPLLTYDTTLSSLSLERQRLDIERKKMQLTDLQAQLAEINKMKPMVVTTPSTKPTTKPTATTKPASNLPEEELGTKTFLVYGTHSGTQNDPLRVWIKEGTTLQQKDIEEIMSKSNPEMVYMVLETRENNKSTGDVVNCMGIQVVRMAVGNTKPGSGSVQDPDPIVKPDPTEETEPVTEEPTEPSEPIVPPEPSEPAEPSDPTEGETTDAEKPPVRTQNTETTYAYVIKSVFTAKPLDPTAPAPTTPPATGPNVNVNSGYTSGEIAQMRKDKQAEIKELQFTIKMAEAEYKIMQKEFDNGVVTSDVDGYVVSVLEPEEAMMNGEPVVKVSGGGGFTIQGTVSELKLESIHIGDPVQIECWMSGTYCEGTITAIGDYPATNQYGWYGDGNPNVSYYPFTVTIDGSENLQAGEYAQITYSTNGAEEDPFYMQCAFLRNENGIYYAFVENEEGKLEKRRLEVGQLIYNGEAIRVYSGLTKQDYVAFPYGSGLKEGAPTVQTSDMNALYGYGY